MGEEEQREEIRCYWGKVGRKEEERERRVSDEYLICYACDHHFSPDTVFSPTDLNISIFKT